MADTINGVPADQYGMWCPHGKRIMVPDPADTSEYPACIFADPWPCSEGCTVAQVTTDMEADADRYEAERWAEYYDMCAEGLYASGLSTYHEYDPAG